MAATAPTMSVTQAHAERIAESVAKTAAPDVDREARFPRESLAALREARMLGAAVPAELGGYGASIEDLTRCGLILGRQCASSAMILAMHHIEVLCIAAHAGDQPHWMEYLRNVEREQRLIASVTSEVGPSGDMRSSVAAVERSGDRFSLTKHATTISYGGHADDLLITARRGPDVPANEQVLVLLQRGEYELRDQGSWDTLGMRGTCSAGATVVGAGPAWEVMTEPFGVIASRTMVPSSHTLWAGVWLGIATDAVARVRAMVRQKARKEPGVVSAAARRLADVVAKLDMFHAEVFGVARDFDAMRSAGDVQTLDGLGFALRVNNLKLIASSMVVEIVNEAMSIGGIMTYKNDSPYSLGRHLRDAHSAAVMVNNDRLREINASMLQVRKGD